MKTYRETIGLHKDHLARLPARVVKSRLTTHKIMQGKIRTGSGLTILSPTAK